MLAVGGDHEVLDQRPRRGCGFSVGQPADGVAVELRPHLDGLELERAVVVRGAPSRLLGDAVLELQVLGEPGDGARSAAGIGPAPSSHAPTLEIGELRVVAHERAVDARLAASTPSPPTAMSDDRRRDDPTPGLSDVRSVLSRSGSIGKDARRRVDRRGVGCARGRSSAEPVRDRRRSRRRPRRGCVVQPVDAGVGDRELVEVARVVVVDRAPGQARRSR